MNPAPVIAIFCYKRAAKLQVCIEALLKNPECPELEIIFFSDGHKTEQDREGVAATRAYIDSLTGFKKVHKIYREKNVGTGANFNGGMNHLCSNYERFIVVEDDLVVSPNYIRYMIDGLEFYKEDKTIFEITGFCFPLELNGYAYDTVIANRICAYGWASWSDRVSKVVWDHDEITRMINTSPQFKKRLNAEGLDLFRMLKKQIAGKISTWDIQFQVHVSENRLKVVYPVVSKVINIGFDTESTNTFGINYLKTPLDSGEKRSFRYCPPDIRSASLQNQLRKPYKLPALASRKIINMIKKAIS